MSLIKIPSQQQGPFSDTFNNCDFTIPENSVYNTDNSYINFVCNVEVDADAFDDDVAQLNTKKTGAVVNVGLVHNTAAVGDRQELFNVSLIKHCRLETTQAGTVLNHRYINVLSNNLKYYEMSKNDIKSMNFQRAGVVFADNKTDPQSLFLKKTKQGTTNSTIMRDVVLKVPLKDLRGIMENGMLPTDKLGRCVLGLELQPSIFKAVDLAQYNLPWLVNDWVAGTTTLTVQPYIPITPAFAQANNMSIEDTLNNHPFYVGMSFRVADSAGTNYKVNVTGVDIDLTTNLINLTIDNAIAVASAAGGHQLTADDLLVVADGNLTYSIDRAELVLEKLDVQSSGMNTLVYREFKTQENNGYTNNQAYTDTFILEPECANVVFTIHDQNTKLLSTPGPYNGTIDNYRMSVDNVDILKRPISVIDRLHADRIAVLFANMDLTLKSHFPYFNSLLSASPPTNSQDEVLIIGTPVPLKETEKLLNVQINGTANPTVVKLYLFKQLVRVLNL